MITFLFEFMFCHQYEKESLFYNNHKENNGKKNYTGLDNENRETQTLNISPIPLLNALMVYFYKSFRIDNSCFRILMPI